MPYPRPQTGHLPGSTTSPQPYPHHGPHNHDPYWPHPQPVPYPQPAHDLVAVISGIFDKRMDRLEDRMDDEFSTVRDRLEKGGDRFTAIEAKLAEIAKPPTPLPSPIPPFEVWFKVLLPPLTWFLGLIWAAWWTGSLEAAMKFADAARKAAGGG